MAHNSGSPPYHIASNPSSISETFTPSSAIEPDSNNTSDADGASVLSSTRSAEDEIYNFIRENGRTYHSYQAGAYLLPNDDVENDRLDLQHEVLKILFGRKILFSPLQNPRRILDIGTGTGKWAIEIANDFPDAEVTGTDLSPIQPQWVPDNVKFVIDDASEEDWLVPNNHYDLIHSRMMLGSFTDFRDIVRRAYRYTKPGGYFECQEIWPPVYCDDGTMPEDHAFAEWIRLQDQAAMNLGRPVRIANKLKKWMEQNGFVDVREEIAKIPINSWPRDPQYKLIGKFWETSLLDGLQGLTLAHFTRGLGWTPEEIEVYLVNVRKALVDRNVHAYQKMYTVSGRKPLPGEQTAKEQAPAPPVPKP